MSEPRDDLAPDTSLRDTIDAAYAAEETKSPAGEGAAPDPVAPSAEVSTTERPQEQGASSPRARGPDGKFIEKSAAETQQTAPKIEPVKAVGQAQQDKPVAAPAGVPETLPAEGRAIFAKLAPEAQTFFAQREQQFNAAMTNRGREVQGLQRQLAEYTDVVAPYQQELAQHGMSPGAAIRQLLGLRDFARKDPAGYAKWFMEGHGLDPSTLSAQAQAGPVDPIVKSLQQQVSQLTGHFTSQQQQQEQREIAHTGNAIEQFRSAVDEKGQALHPYYDQVETEAAFIAAAIRRANPNADNAAILKVAYDRAAWSNPATRQAMMKAKFAASEAARNVEIQRHATAAARAGSSVTGAPGAGSGGRATPPDNLRDVISQAWDAHSGAGRA